MTTPDQKRDDAERLRELATTMDRQAEEMHSLLSDVKSSLKGDIWSGPAPDELEGKIQGWIDSTESAAGQIEENAQLCRKQASGLDDDADEQEKDEKDDEDGN